jgi:hypothetical protein
MSKTKVALMILAGAAAVAIVIGSSAPSVTASPQEGDPALEEFVPSEELPSDSAVAFPVDI